MREKQRDIQDTTTSGNMVYIDDRIAVFEDLFLLDEGRAVRPESVIYLLCRKGKGGIYINGDKRALGENDLLICPPNTILEYGGTENGFSYCCISFTPDLFRTLDLDISVVTWERLKMLEKSPIIALSPDEVNAFRQYYDLLGFALTGKRNKHWKRTVGFLLQAFVYEFQYPLGDLSKLPSLKYTSAERLLKDFLHLIASSYPKVRVVSWYADRLHVTPKYLSAVCRDTCGQTPSQVINQYVMKDILFLLKDPGKTIQEIANELDFPNLSFFGKYVKRNTGLSPKKYREKLGEED